MSDMTVWPAEIVSVDALSFHSLCIIRMVQYLICVGVFVRYGLPYKVCGLFLARNSFSRFEEGSLLATSAWCSDMSSCNVRKSSDLCHWFSNSSAVRGTRPLYPSFAFRS